MIGIYKEKYHGRAMGYVTWVLLLSLSLPVAWADTQRGVDWLLAQQQGDGSFVTAADLATQIQSTAEALYTLHELGQARQPGIANAERFLEENPLYNTEYLSRKIVAAAAAGRQVPPQWIEELLSHQGRDGGFGDRPGWQSTVFDSAHALAALAATNIHDAYSAGRALDFLLERQQNDGSWTHDGSTQPLYLTALSAQTVWKHRHHFPVDASLDAAQSYLLTKLGDGSAHEVYAAASALLAIIPRLSDIAPVADAVALLRDAQGSDGSWGGVYSSALALRVLALAERTVPNPDLGTLTGRVVDGGSGLSMEGVTATLEGPLDDSRITATDGIFRFMGLPEGDYTLILTRSDYDPLSTSTRLAQGATLDLGDLVMIQGANPTTGTVRGMISDAQTGLPLAGVSVITDQSSGTLSAADGSYRIDNLTPGIVAVNASLDGYYSAGGSATLAAGGAVVFSPALRPESGPTPGNEAAMFGRIIAADTGVPLEGVTVAINGATQAMVLSDTDGRFRIAPLEPGSHEIEARLEGYQTVKAGALVSEGQQIEFSPTLYRESDTGSGTNSASISGLVVDSTTNEPLAGVSIQVTQDGGTQTVASGTDGHFGIVDITSAEVTLVSNLEGYRQVALSLPVEPLTANDIGQIRLRPIYVEALLPDLTVETIDSSALYTDAHTLAVSGTIEAVVKNRGHFAAQGDLAVLAFYDADADGRYHPDNDSALGTGLVSLFLPVGGEATVPIELAGPLPFRDAPVTVWIDSVQRIAEKDETNNTLSTSTLCETALPTGSFDPVVKYHALAGHNIIASTAVVNLTDDNGDGTVDRHDIPDIVVPIMTGSQFAGGVIKAVSGDDGHELFTTSRDYLVAALGDIAVGDIDGDGLVEIVSAHADGRHLVAFENTGEFKWLSDEDLLPGRYDAGGAIAIADLDGTGPPEIIVGASVYDAQGRLLADGRDLGGTRGFNGHTAISAVADIDHDGRLEVIAGRTAYAFDDGVLTIQWDRPDLRDGFVGIGDFDQDPYPEIVLMSSGRLYLLNHDGTNVEIWGSTATGVPIPGGGYGGAPTIADFDTDGSPEIGIAGSSYYSVFDTDGSLLWSSPTRDYSSGVTGSTSFDFEDDGVAEIIYRDEFYLRIYRGADGFVLYEHPMRSGTGTEYPVVADVDNDGRAEIVISSSWNLDSQINGLYVIDNADGAWAATRGIWNQNSYHITNVDDDGGIPHQEQSSWQVHNSYRLNAFIDQDPYARPDLSAARLRLIDNGTGEPFGLEVLIGNGGSGDAGPVTLAFYQGDPQTGGVPLGTLNLDSLGANQWCEQRLEAVTLNGTGDIYALVDPADTVHECNETNNRVSLPLSGSPTLGSLQVATDTALYGPNTPVVPWARVHNDGSFIADYRVRLLIEEYDGTPVAELPQQTLAALAAGTEQTLTTSWNTGTTLAGDYRLHGLLYDGAGRLLDEAMSEFAIGQGSESQPGLRITTDRARYHINDSVEIGTLVRNLTDNLLIEAATLDVRITDPARMQIYQQTLTLGQLPAGATRDRMIVFDLNVASPGAYLAEVRLLDGNGNLLSIDTSGFQVSQLPQQPGLPELTGEVQVQLPQLRRGGTNLCTDRLTNLDPVNRHTLYLRKLLVRLDSGEVVHSSETSMTLAEGESRAEQRTILTAELTAGDYGCLLQARTQTAAWQTLDFDHFTLIDPSGVLYDARSREPLADVVLTLLDAAGTPLPAACLGAAQQGQSSPVDGSYRFDLNPGADPVCPAEQSEYHIALTPPPGYRSAAAIPPEPGALDPSGGPDPYPVVPQATAPVAGEPTIYYLRLRLQAGDQAIVNNHIPLEREEAASIPLLTPWAAAALALLLAAFGAAVNRNKAGNTMKTRSRP